MYYRNYLYHHGIKGQRWGIRRFQNPDGSVTSKGAQRYYSEYGDNYHRSNDPQNAPNKTGTKKKALTDKQKKALIIAGAATLAVVGGVALYKSGAINKMVKSSVSKGKNYISLNASKKHFSEANQLKKVVSSVQKPASINQNIRKPEIQRTNVARTEVNRTEIPKTTIARTEVKRTEIPKTTIARTEVKRTEVPKLTFGEDSTFTSSDMSKLASNMSKAFGSVSSTSKSLYINEGQNYAEELLRKNMSKLGM